MSETLTVGMIVWPLLGLIGIGAVIAAIFVVLSIFAEGFKH